MDIRMPRRSIHILVVALLAAAAVVWLVDPTDALAAPAPVSKAPDGNFWLVKLPPVASNRPSDQHPNGDAVVENLLAGQRPSAPAVYLGSTTADIGVHLSEAAHKLGLNPAAANIKNPFAKAGVGDLLGTFGIIAAGLAAPVIGAAGVAGADAGAAGAGGGGAGTAVKAGENALNGNQSSDAASALSTAKLSALAAAGFLTSARLVNSDTNVDVAGGWFQPVYKTVVDYAWMLALLALGFAGFAVMASGWTGGGLTVALAPLARVPVAALEMIAAPVLVALAITFVDLLCADIVKTYPAGHGVLIGLGAAYGVGAIGAHFFQAVSNGGWWLALFGFGAAWALALELLFRSLAIYMSLLFIPLAAAAAIFPGLAAWRNKLAYGLLIIVFSKLVIVLALSVAGAAAAAGIASASVAAVGFGLGALFLTIATPWALHSAVSHGQGWHSPHAQAARSSVRGAAGGTGLSQQVRAGHARIVASHDGYRPAPSPSPPLRRPHPIDRSGDVVGPVVPSRPGASYGSLPHQRLPRKGEL